MATPYLTIGLEKITHNARRIVTLCERHGIEVAGVTKAVCGMPEWFAAGSCLSLLKPVPSNYSRNQWQTVSEFRRNFS